MVDFWYLVLKKFYSNDISLLYGDTDSFIIRVRFLFGWNVVIGVKINVKRVVGSEMDG